MLILVYDTETTGLPLWNDPSEDPRQPRIVELAASLVDTKTRQTVESFDCLVRPDGWEIPAEASAIHGITTERALADGVPEQSMLDTFLAMWRRSDSRVGHNESFDARMFRIAIKRAWAPEIAEPIAEQFKLAQTYCTMRKSTPILRLPGPRGLKWPKLTEAYAHFFGRELVGAHSARGDVDATIQVYFALQGDKVSA